MELLLAFLNSLQNGTLDFPQAVLGLVCFLLYVILHLLIRHRLKLKELNSHQSFENQQMSEEIAASLRREIAVSTTPHRLEAHKKLGRFANSVYVAFTNNPSSCKAKMDEFKEVFYCEYIFFSEELRTAFHGYVKACHEYHFNSGSQRKLEAKKNHLFWLIRQDLELPLLEEAVRRSVLHRS